jgi:hypothetical protein
MDRPTHHHEALEKAGFQVTGPTPYNSDDESIKGEDSDIYGNLSQPADDDQGEKGGYGMGMC